MAESSPKGKKTLWEKEKLFITSNLSFSYSVFQTPAQGLLGNGVNPLPDNKILDWSKLKRIEHNILKCI